MIVLMFFFSLSFFISTLILLLGFVLSLFKSIEQEKISPFECGFVPQSKSRSPVSMHFFLIAILFLIFDIELVILFPFFLSLKYSIFSSFIFILILLILLLGVLLEWNQLFLEWTNF